ncbi:uncharacterized protein LOC124535678 [Vanessa cardui]|uniref:uncharacterized protein LOC124535678 n=1 Tax=Vanessa cardui TaxID=171605 RepID=UPI001F145EDD|nr:uncharacterized protein LOC124535678 [Vanessa cardui]
MDPRRGIKEFCQKIKDRFKGRPDKKSNNCYWPEFISYCGCCTLSTGIYIRSIITLIISSLFLAINGTILNYLISLAPVIYNTNLTDSIDYVATDRESASNDHASLIFIYKCLLAYYIIWICFKVIYLLTVLFTAYAIFKKNTWMLKVLLYISVPNMILDFFISFIGTVVLSDALKFVLVACNLSEGYNILAINSEYKRMRGKSRLAVEDIQAPPRTDQIYVNSFITERRERYYNNHYQSHCRSCSCYFENINGIVTTDIRSVATIPSTVTIVENSNNIIANPTRTNGLNTNHPSSTTVNNQNNTAITEEGNEAVIVSEDGRVCRPNTLGPFNAKGKVDLPDIPFIYDEQQLNVGSSPVIEDRNINSLNNKNV